jgi:hypothetical protein
MGKSQQRTRIKYRDAQFFVQLALQGVARHFAALKFTAGKLPESGQGFAGRTLRNQNLPLRIVEHRRNHVNNR